MKDILAFVEQEQQASPNKDVRFADIYHSANRYALGSSSCLPIILPSTVLYDLERQRLVLGQVPNSEFWFCFLVFQFIAIACAVLKPLYSRAQLALSAFDSAQGVTLPSLLWLRQRLCAKLRETLPRVCQRTWT